MSLRDAMATVTLVVTNLERARDFYGGTLGLEELGQLSDEESGMAYKCGYGTYLYLYERPTPAGSTGTVCAFGVKDVEGTVEELRRKGVQFEEYDIPEIALKTVNGVATQGPVKTAWTIDPFGNILAIDNSRELLTSLAAG